MLFAIIIISYTLAINVFGFRIVKIQRADRLKNGVPTKNDGRSIDAISAPNSEKTDKNHSATASSVAIEKNSVRTQKTATEIETQTKAETKTKTDTETETNTPLKNSGKDLSAKEKSTKKDSAQKQDSAQKSSQAKTAQAGGGLNSRDSSADISSHTNETTPPNSTPKNSENGSEKKKNSGKNTAKNFFAEEKINFKNYERIPDLKIFAIAIFGGALGEFIAFLIFRYRTTNTILMVLLPVVTSVWIYFFYLAVARIWIV